MSTICDPQHATDSKPLGPAHRKTIIEADFSAQLSAVDTALCASEQSTFVLSDCPAFRSPLRPAFICPVDTAKCPSYSYPQCPAKLSTHDTAVITT